MKGCRAVASLAVSLGVVLPLPLHAESPGRESPPPGAAAMQAELAKFQDQESVEIFFSAHGVPKSYVEEAGDPYKVRTPHSRVPHHREVPLGAARGDARGEVGLLS